MALERDINLIYETNEEGIPTAINEETFEETLVGLLKEHEKGIGRLDTLWNYYDGKQRIIEQDRDKYNNKVMVNHAEFITDFATSYFMGNPIQYTWEVDEEGENPGAENIQQAFTDAKINIIDTKLATYLSIFGESIEIVYQDRYGNTKSGVLDPRNAFIVDDDTVEYIELLGVHRYPKINAQGEEDGEVIQVYTALQEKRVYSYNRGILKLEEDPKNIVFSQIPLIRYANKPNKKGDFESVISLIDAYNVLESSRINDKEQFVDSILAVYGAILGDSLEQKTETSKTIADLGMVELPENSKMEFVTKTFQEADINILKNDIKEDIHKISKVPDLTDENFASNSSGVAMGYKLLGLEQLAQQKEAWYKIGIRKRIELYREVLGIRQLEVDADTITPVFTRSLPTNELETAQIVNLLENKVSRKTLLQQISFIEDVNQEIKRLKQEEEERQEQRNVIFGNYNIPDETQEIDYGQPEEEE